ncbi:MAG: response regulator [Proteobacteria bacterium]|nr:response regulator [Pseudomonadota bacterium]
MTETAPPTLFAVDDDQGMLDFIVRVARLAGYQTQSFTNGKAMLQHLDERPDVIILDMTMPGLDGFEVIEALVARKYAGRLIIASGFSGDVTHMADLLARGQKLDVVGTLTKPFRAAELQEMLASIQTQ